MVDFRRPSLQQYVFKCVILFFITSQQISSMYKDIIGFSLCGYQTMQFSSCHHCDFCSLRSTFKCPYSPKSRCQVICKSMEEVVPPKNLQCKVPILQKNVLLCAHTHLCSWWEGGQLDEDYSNILKSMANFSALLNQSLLQDKKKEQKKESEKPCGKFKRCLCFASC